MAQKKETAGGASKGLGSIAPVYFTTASQEIAFLRRRVIELEKALQADNQTIRLHLGEVTTQEMRAIRAAFSWVLFRGRA